MNPELADHPLMPELRRIVLRIALMSHVGAAQMERSSKGSDDAIGGRRPSGGIDHKDDAEAGYRQKSDLYFVRRLARCQNGEQLGALLREAEQALLDWRRTPEVAGVELERNSLRWKCRIAEDERSIDDVVNFYGVSRSTVQRYRARYRGVLRAT